MLETGDIITLGSHAWRLCAPLGGSSYGVLWRAESLAGRQPAALKLVNSAQMTLAAPAQRARWCEAAATEIAFLRALQPWDRRHIVRLLDSGMHEGLPAAALELLETDLAQHLAALRARGSAPAPLEALDWLAQVNAALAKVHGYGWRHLDLKPANLLLDRDGALKLADFGTSRALADRAAHAYTGTAAWQAPEQFFGIDGGYLTDARSDYFALGALLYYLVTGSLLRYSNACACALRAHGAAAGARLLAQPGNGLPPVLAQDEAALFARLAAGDMENSGVGRPASASAPDPTPALALLRALLQPRPERRPRHALEISRLIAAARAGIAAPAGACPAAATRLRSAA
ncbi:protein kinase [Massilia sp. 9096]|uniref:protein kinase domain-containing protein n=1 Tax=Massilia sp. 9096 TaxID=1500894 RepID=UPI00056670CC|nr:protein kinase [Massilia sp. 9096]